MYTSNLDTKMETWMTKKECPIQKHAWFIRTLLLIRLKTAGKWNNVQIYWRPWELAEISHKNLQNLIKAAFVEKQIYIPSKEHSEHLKTEGKRKKQTEGPPHLFLIIFAVLCASFLLS